MDIATQFKIHLLEHFLSFKMTRYSLKFINITVLNEIPLELFWLFSLFLLSVFTYFLKKKKTPQNNNNNKTSAAKGFRRLFNQLG